MGGRLALNGGQDGTSATAVLPLSVTIVKGRIIDFRVNVGATAITGNSTVVVDLKKNGASILSSTITLNNTHSAYTGVQATMESGSEPNVVAGDHIEVSIVATVGSGTLPIDLAYCAEQIWDA